MTILVRRCLTIILLISGNSLFAQTLVLPPRPANAPDGDVFAQNIAILDLDARDRAIANEFLTGNVPDFLREFCPVTVTNVSDARTNIVTFFAAPDYLAVGSDTNYFIAPIAPSTAQRIADKLNCTLPTRKMVDAIYAAAQVKLAPSPIAPSAAMTTVPVFLQANKTIWAQRMGLTNLYPPGALVAGDKKDIVISPRLAVATNSVAIYGWHCTNGVAIQPLYLGHAWWWVDYSQGVRLISQRMVLNGKVKSVTDVLADPKLCGLISDEGVISKARYCTDFTWPDKINLPWPQRFSPNLDELSPRAFPDNVPPGIRTVTPQRGFPAMEWTRQIKTLDGVRILIDAPAPESFTTNKAVELVFYALPNGNTIEETMGRKISPGDDWHFDIQHIGAQTRWLRQALTNETLVVAYFQADAKSWPAWRKTHSNRRIMEMVDAVCGIFASNRTEIVLASHSGGGSFVFGYLDAANEIPAKIRRIAFLDSDYDYDSTLDAKKMLNWLKASDSNRLCVLAYQDYLALYNGRPFVSEAGGTWARSRAMREDFSPQFLFTSQTNSGLEIYSTSNRQIEFLLKENPDHKILHTVQVERNGFIQALLSGTDLDGHGYAYLGKRAYTNWIYAR